VLRWFVRHGTLDATDALDMAGWEHGGGFSLDASVRIEALDRAGLERLLRYCARGPLALDRLHIAFITEPPQPAPAFDFDQRRYR